MSAYRSDEDRDMADILGYFNTELRRDAVKRRELAAAVRRKDDSAIRRVAHAVWEGIKFVAPFAFSALLAILGIPAIG